MVSIPDLNSGALAPIAEEVDLESLIVSGEIPEQLNGTLVRNGPNPFNGHFSGHDVLSWWPEAAMLHGISFSNGHVMGYRNRWVQTRGWGNYHHQNNAIQLVNSNPNVNVVVHAGEILALAEGGVPAVITQDLQTIGEAVVHNGFSEGVSAHPKIDPVTDELITFRSGWEQPWLKYSVSDADGLETLATDIHIPAPSMMHDMAITATHSIFLDLGVGYDFSLFSQGYKLPICWQEERVSRLGIIPRSGGTTRWFEIKPCFIQHVVNAYDQSNGNIVLEVVRYPWYLRLENSTLDFLPNPLGVLWRYVINPGTGKVHEQQLSDINVEMPRINESFTGRASRYSYMVEQPSSVEMRGIIRYDAHLGVIKRHIISEGDQNSEPVFVPRPDGVTEEDGWLLVCVYRQASDTSEVLILDAQNIDCEPVSRISLPRRIPAGFHGAWLPDAA